MAVKSFEFGLNFKDFLNLSRSSGVIPESFLADCFKVGSSIDVLSLFKSFYLINHDVRVALSFFCEDCLFDSVYSYDRSTGDKFYSFTDVESLVFRFLIRKGGIVTSRELRDELKLPLDKINPILDRIDKNETVDGRTFKIFRYFKGCDVVNTKRNGRKSVSNSTLFFLFFDINFFIDARKRFLD